MHTEYVVLFVFVYSAHKSRVSSRMVHLNHVDEIYHSGPYPTKYLHLYSMCTIRMCLYTTDTEFHTPTPCCIVHNGLASRCLMSMAPPAATAATPVLQLVMRIMPGLRRQVLGPTKRLSGAFSTPCYRLQAARYIREEREICVEFVTPVSVLRPGKDAGVDCLRPLCCLGR